jgi:tetratricopeptide (TPR) repeat protein
MNTLSPPRSARARTGRCYVPTAPLTRRGSGAEGAEILQEVPGELGVLLWGTLRDVMLYLGAPAAERGGLFPADAGEARRAEIGRCGADPALWAPLLVVAEMMEGPGEASRARVAHACRAVARWAEGESPATRLAFSQAAALARPGDPRLALATARLARDAADHARAETWFRRAVKLARGRDWESYGWAFVGLGVLYHRSGNAPAARAVVGRALRTARRRRMRGLAGAAHHELFVFALQAHRVDEAYAHAEAAIQAYGPAHPRLPALAHDVGCFWSEQGYFARALPVFEQILPCFTEPAARALVVANAARSAAGAGDRKRYEENRAATLALLDAGSACEAVAAESLLLLARADSSMCEWARAEAAAAHAVTIASARNESHTRMLADAQLDSARRRLALRTPAAEEPAAVALEAERLAVEFGRFLRRRSELQAAAA